MREIVETGTDVATVAIGDPTLLESLRACNGRGYDDELSHAVAGGALWTADIGSDGAYLFHVFVDEEPSPPVATWLRDPVIVECLRVPSGRLLVAEQECFIGALSPRDYPHMGREVGVPPGDYQLTAYRVEAPDDYLDSRLSEQATSDQRRAWSMGNSLPAWCFVATIAALVAGYFLYLETVSTSLALLPPAIAALAWWWQARYRRGAAYQSAQSLFRTLEREIPSIAVVMRRHAAGGPTSGCS